jgi:LCP family protein required for cell wall assembly
LRQRLLVALVGLFVVLMAAWLALIIVSRIDELFFPGQGIPVGGLSALPGVEEDDEGPEGRIDILVMGLDRRPREGDAPTRTDTIFLLTIDPQSKTAGILGIPRDLLVEIPYRDGGGFYEDRVNTAYVIGESQGYAGGGPGLVKKVIEHNLGISVDHYLLIDFEGFTEIIDELGGIDLYVEEEVYDPFYSRTELPGDYYPLSFEVGEHHMDGQTALDYSRTRYGSSDLDRIQRQQRVIFAAIDKAIEGGLVRIDRLLDLWGRYKDAVQTDVNDLQMPGFAALAARLDPTRISALSLGAATRPWVMPDGRAVLLVDKEMVQELVQALFTDRELSDEAALVEVQNGAGADGLAAQVVEYLTGFGFSTSSLSPATIVDGTIRPLTEIIDFSGKEHTVERLARLLAVPSERVRRAEVDDGTLRTIEGADVLVILGADAQARDFGGDVSGG